MYASANRFCLLSGWAPGVIQFQVRQGPKKNWSRYLQVGCASCNSTNSVKALKEATALLLTRKNHPRAHPWFIYQTDSSCKRFHTLYVDASTLCKQVKPQIHWIISSSTAMVLTLLSFHRPGWSWFSRSITSGNGILLYSSFCSGSRLGKAFSSA